MIKTAKFGGTSLADAVRMIHAAEIIKSDPSRRYIVVSAPGKREEDDTKITDLLYRCVSCNNYCETAFNIVHERFTEIIAGLQIDLDITEDIELIKRNIASGADEDYIVSRGEYLSAVIFAKYLGFTFIDSADIIKFKGKKLDAKFTKKIAAKRLKEIKYAVIPGFYGSEHDGTIKTFSRGGSDYSGAIIADAVKANLYENWTDVDGFLACDPRLTPNPRKINQLSYDELYRLSRMGAGVLHPCSVLPLKKSGIMINLKNTFNPNSDGTLIMPFGNVRKEQLAGISVKKDCSLISFRYQSSEKAGALKRLINIFDTVGAKTELITTDISGINFVLKSPLVLEDLNYIKNRLSKKELIQTNTILITFVGYRGKDLLKKAMSFLDSDIDINFISYDGGADLIIGVSHHSNINKVVERLYQGFFEN